MICFMFYECLFGVKFAPLNLQGAVVLVEVVLVDVVLVEVVLVDVVDLSLPLGKSWALW